MGIRVITILLLVFLPACAGLRVATCRCDQTLDRKLFHERGRDCDDACVTAGERLPTP